MASDVIVKNGRLYSNELRKLAKAMNQRMVELEKRGYNAPAYQAAQARLESLGVRKGSAVGRRFRETGYFANKNEMAQYEAALRRFKEQETSKLKGYKKYRRDVLQGLEERYHYKEHGLSDEDVMEFWESMPDNERDRMYGSDEVFLIVEKYQQDVRSGKIVKEDALSIREIVDRVNDSKSLSSALKTLGIDSKEYLSFKSGALGEL